MRRSFPLLEQSAIKTLDCETGDVIFHQGQKADAIYQVVSGEVHLIRENSEGQTVLLFRAWDQDFFAEASLGAERYHCMAIANKPSQVRLYSAQQIQQTLCSDSQFALQWIEFLSIQLRRQRSMVERLNMKSAADRLVHYLQTEGDTEGEIEIRGTLGQLAQQLGLSPESFYRTLSKMKKESKIEQKGPLLRLL